MRLYPQNPRQITKARHAQLAQSLTELGDLSGIVHNIPTDEIIGGNQRAQVFDLVRQGTAALEIVNEYEEPTPTGTVLEGFVVWHGERFAYRGVAWDAATCRMANIKANALGGAWDWDILAGWDSVDLQAWGLDDEALAAWNNDAANLREMLTAEDAEGDAGKDTEPQIDKAQELLEKWDVQPGDMWQLGKHRVICGDCTDKGIVDRVMGGELCSLVCTDPPYGVSYADKNKFLNAIDKGNCIQAQIKNDHGSKEQIQAIWRSAFERMESVMLPGAVVYCFMPQGGDQMMMMMMMMMMGAGIEPRHELIWLKNNHVLGRVDYAYKHEPILYAWKDGGHKFYGDFQTSILEFSRPSKSDLHPTTKPAELIERLVNNSSRANELVLDPFLGSGTTLIACENLGRRCRGIEIEPKYVAVTLERWHEHTGLMPEKLD